MGGTSTRAMAVDFIVDSSATVCRAARTIEVSSLPLSDAADPEQALTRLWADLADALGVTTPTEVALALPGPVVDGSVECLPTLFGQRVRNLPAADLAASLWPDARLWILNDLTAAGQAMLGIGHRDFCVVTLGSGIGAKLYTDGRPLLGPRGIGGEIGHWVVAQGQDVACDCGGTGHLGAIASGRGTLQWVQRQAKQDPAGFVQSSLGAAVGGAVDALSAESIAQHFHAGDRWVAAALAVPAGALGQTFALIHLATGIERFFVVGGFGQAMGATYAASIAQHAAASCWRTGLEWASAIEVPPAGDHIGLRGAMAYAAAHAPDRMPDHKP